MGRYAQQRKRGGHLGADGGLPVGPTVDKLSLAVYVGYGQVSWVGDGPDPYMHWRSRWRLPAVNMLWTLSASPIATTLDGDQQASPFAAVHGQQQDCEAIFTDGAGNPVSQWSPYVSLVP